MPRHQQPLPEDYDGPLVKPFVGDLLLILGHNMPNAVSMPPASELAEQGISPEQAWEEAFSNFDTHSPPLFMDQINDAGLMVLEAEYEPWLTPSLLLKTGVFQTFIENNNLDALLICLPARSGIFFTSADLPHSLEMIHTVIASEGQQDHPQSECVFKLHSGRNHYEVVT